MTTDVAGLLDELIRADEPGVAIGVYRDGELVDSAAAGCAVVEHGVPVTAATVFDIASVSKHTTAACLLLLARDGLVDLDRDVRDVLPELALAQPVTLRQCLTHTGGLREYFALYALNGEPLPGLDEDRVMRLIARLRDLDFAPGSAFSYANTGYVLAAVVVRRLSGVGLAGFARERVFGPLGMAVTHYRDDVTRLVPRLANGYLAAGGGFVRCDVDEDVVGDGAIVTSIEDLAGWHRFVASGAVLGTDIRDALLDRQVLTGGTRIGYALGLEEIGDGVWKHTGSMSGYRSATVYVPAEGLGATVLANRNDHSPAHLAAAVVRTVRTGGDVRSAWEEVRGVPAPAPVAGREREALIGRWYDRTTDLYLDVYAAAPAGVAARFDGEEYRWRLGIDGTWHGTGTAAGATLRLAGDELLEGDSLSADVTARYVRADAPTDAGPVPAGRFTSTELAVDATLDVTDGGAVALTIGATEPRPLVAAAPGVWAGEGITVRADGTDLLVSVSGAHRVRFGAA